jgi:Flp pilus assembly protein TadG
MNKQVRKKSTAQSLVEFALIGPLFLLIIFGILEGGRLIWTNHTVGNTTKEGARYATVRGSGSKQADAPATAASIKNQMLTVSTGLNASSLNVSMVLLDGNMDDRSRFRIETTYQYKFIVTSIFGMNGITLKATSTDQFWREPDP